jgi:hypothetical protein
MADRGTATSDFNELQSTPSDFNELQSTPSDVVSLDKITSALELSPDLLTIAERQAEEAALRRAREWQRLLSLLVLAVVVVIAWLVVQRSATVQQVLLDHGWYMALAAILGASVGTSEVVSRYRDEPTQALKSLPALTYLGLNALVSVSVYGLLTRYASTLIPTLADDPLMRSIAAGFGAMAILRSKFFTLRTEKGEDIGVGPDAAIAAFLSAADRGVDRKRAKRRLALVFNSTSKVTDYGYAKDFIKVSLLSFQNLDEVEKQSINKKIDEIYADESGMYPSNELKLQAMCYAVLVIVGEYNFNRLIGNLVDFIRHSEKEMKDRHDLAVKTKEVFVDQLRQSAEPPRPRSRGGLPSRRRERPAGASNGTRNGPRQPDEATPEAAGSRS